MSESDEFIWTESTASDGRTRTAKDSNGQKRREEFYGLDGSRRIWTTSPDDKLTSYQEFSSRNLLVLERAYDANGTERSAIGYFESGVKHFESEYDDRGVMSKQTKWLPSGRLVSVVHYLNSYRHGLSIHYSEETGALISKEEYLNDHRHGYCEQYYTKPGAETIKSRGHYVAGQVEGHYQEFYPNGVLSESGFVENRKHEGERKRFYENGVLRQIIRYSGGEVHGDQEEFYQSGRLKRCLPMKNGKMHGIEKSFNENGQLTYQSTYFEGASQKDTSLFETPIDSNSPLELYHSNGKLMSRHTRRNGFREGPFEIFRASGTRRETGNYENDKLSGPNSFYDADGILIETVCYKSGLLDGPRTSYARSLGIETVISSIRNYETGVLQATREYHPSGRLAKSVEFREDGSGIERLYADDESLQRETEVRANYSRTTYSREGYDRAYGANGILWEAFYLSGQKVGTHRLYSPTGILSEVHDYSAGRLKEKSLCNDSGLVYRKLSYFDDGAVASDAYVPGVARPNGDAAPLDVGPLKKGSLVGTYEIIRSIGHGGMGDVFLALEKALDRRIALKLIRGEADAESRSRFESEGRALARIRHRNVVTVFSVGEHLGMPYMAMEYIEGWPLNTLLGQGLLGFNEQISLFRQMLEGMLAAHDVTVLHRDLKPANIIVSKSLEIKIIDFGISKILAADAGLTAPNMAMGTIRYMSPEVAQGRPASVPTDIYSLGIILFEMLTGETPFNGANQLETLELIKTSPVIFPDGISDILPESLKSLVIKMTAKRVEDRPSTLHEVLRELDLISFEHLPEEFKVPMRPELEIANLDEARSILKQKGHSSSELSLILNLASRIQQKMLADMDQTQPLGLVADFVISPEALDQATKRYVDAKKELANHTK
jgi:serine/threonine protein kinase/antitoxin component YwqK of YwqJK toxin-antitoxin module